MSWIAVALWGAAVGLDGTSAIQSMLSRPIVAAPVTGALLGHPAEGVALGICLELFALMVLPIGASRYPESGVGAVAGAFALIEGGGPEFSAVALLLAVGFGLGWERVAGGSAVLLRRTNEWLVADAPSRGQVGAGRLARLHLTAITIDGARALMVTLVGALMGSWLVGGLMAHWRFGDEVALRALTITLAMILGATLSLFGARGTRRLALLLGVVCGLAILSFR